MSKTILVNAYRARTKSLEVIFTSFSALYDVYHAVLKSANVPSDKMELYEKVKRSAAAKELEISDPLHTQAFILMTGLTEALLKDTLEDLILENFHKLNDMKDINFNISDLKKIVKQSEQGEYVSLKLAEGVIKQLNNSQDKNAKINFQNTQGMQTTLQRMFDIKIDIETDYYKNIHVYWQKRHSLVHSSGVVDNRYLNNVNKVGYSKEKLGEKIVISKKDYDDAKRNFEFMLQNLEDLIAEKELTIEGIG